MAAICCFVVGSAAYSLEPNETDIRHPSEYADATCAATALEQLYTLFIRVGTNRRNEANTAEFRTLMT